MNAVYNFIARLVVAAAWDVWDATLTRWDTRHANAINTESDET